MNIRLTRRFWYLLMTLALAGAAGFGNINITRARLGEVSSLDGAGFVAVLLVLIAGYLFIIAKSTRASRRKHNTVDPIIDLEIPNLNHYRKTKTHVASTHRAQP